jgi:hypothetical protein
LIVIAAQAAKAFDLHLIASGQLSFSEQELLAFAHGPYRA